MPCPACVGIAGAAVFGGGYLLALKDPRRILNIACFVLLLGFWTIYFVSFRGEIVVRGVAEVASVLLLLAGFARSWKLRKLGYTTPVDLFMQKFWRAAAAIVRQPLVIGLKCLLLSMFGCELLFAVSISSAWYVVVASVLIMLILIRIPRGIEAWRESKTLACPFGFGQKKGDLTMNLSNAVGGESRGPENSGQPPSNDPKPVGKRCGGECGKCDRAKTIACPASRLLAASDVDSRRAPTQT